MKGFDVLRVKSAVKSHNRFDLSKTHLTTMNFGEIMPLYVEETIPGDKFKVDASYFSRMAPLVKPTYGKFSFKTVSAFVPYHMLANDAEAWLAGKTTWEGTTPHQRYITMFNLAFFIISYCTGTSVQSADAADIVYTDGNGALQMKLWSTKGKYYIKILNALGYAVPQNFNIQSTSTWYTTIGQQKLSAYPLLAFAKLYNDYMSQSQRFNSSILSNFLNAVKYQRTFSGYTQASGEINYAGINTILSNIFLNYENDYFTSAWQQPNNAINSIQDITNIAVPSNVSYPEGTVHHNTADNYLAAPHNGNATEIGQRALDFLKSFDDWVRRNNYSGSRAVQQIYSRFGIKTDDYRSHYANVFKTDSLPVQVGDVTATGPQFVSAGSANNVGLGDYAGKGIMNGGNSIDISVSDYGILFILGYFTVVPMDSFGFDHRVLRNDPLDYYNPEFDGIGADPISYGEVYSNPIATPTGDTTTDDTVFGFTERYNAYRYGRDVITGEFRTYKPNGDMSVWHTGRNLNAIRAAGNMVAQSTAMNTLPQTDSEYNRIFAASNIGFDHFYLTAHFNVNAIRPMLNLNQVVKLGEGDTSVPRNGNVIS